ncbi:MAG: hypothetical protein MUF64_23640 [Polyangiaceae bacterium]|nr:hypothetical protein [Polyangiaceae bacterium]
MQKDFATDLVVCACFGDCEQECAPLCAEQTPPPECNECLNDTFQSGACGLDSCASPSCKAFSACVLSCP